MALWTGRAVCAYSARQLADNVPPKEATDVVLEAAAEMEALAEELRCLVRLRLAERRERARWLRSMMGLSTSEISRRLGVSDRCVRYYVSGRRWSRRARQNSAPGSSAAWPLEISRCGLPEK